MSRPWCPGSGRAVPIPANESRYKPRQVQCPACRIRLHAPNGYLVPRHRGRGCLIVGCEKPQTGGGLCREHNREIVGTEK